MQDRCPVHYNVVLQKRYIDRDFRWCPICKEIYRNGDAGFYLWKGYRPKFDKKFFEHRKKVKARKKKLAIEGHIDTWGNSHLPKEFKNVSGISEIPTESFHKVDKKEAVKKHILKKKEERAELLQNFDFPKVTFLVRSNIADCINQKHKYINIKARVDILIYNERTEVEFDAFFCDDCRAYFISKDTYEKLSAKGKILCPVLSRSQLKKRQSMDITTLSPKSKLSMQGYNVRKQDNYDAYYRQSLLKDMIDNNLCSKEEIVKLLNFFINTHINQDNFIQAVERWKEDLSQIECYDGNRKNVKKIVIEF